MIHLDLGGGLLAWIAFLCATIDCGPVAHELELSDHSIQTNVIGTNILRALKNLIQSNENITNKLKEFSIPHDTLIRMVDSPLLTILFETFPALKPFEGYIKETTKDVIKILNQTS